MILGDCGRRGCGRRRVRRGVSVAVDVMAGRRRRESIVNGMLGEAGELVFY